MPGPEDENAVHDDLTEIEDQGQIDGDNQDGAGAPGEVEGSEDAGAGEAEGTLFGFADEEDGEQGGEDETPLIRSFRERERKLQRELHELRSRAAPAKEPELGPKPSMESCDYDEERFEQELEAWNGRKQTIESKAQEAEQQRTQAAKAWNDRVENFTGKAKELKIPDFDGDVQFVSDAFGDDAEGQAAKAFFVIANDPRLVSALRRSPAKLERLVSLKKNAPELLIAIGEMKGAIKAMPSRAAPPPESLARGGAPSAAATDKKLEQLEKEADRTGDRTKVINYKREMREKARA